MFFKKTFVFLCHYFGGFNTPPIFIKLAILHGFHHEILMSQAQFSTKGLITYPVLLKFENFKCEMVLGQFYWPFHNHKFLFCAKKQKLLNAQPT